MSGPPIASLGVAAGFGVPAPRPAGPAPPLASGLVGDGCSATAAVAATATRAATVMAAPRARDMGNCSDPPAPAPGRTPGRQRRFRSICAAER
jgi:hypothetical protein